MDALEARFASRAAADRPLVRRGPARLRRWLPALSGLLLGTAAAPAFAQDLMWARDARSSDSSNLSDVVADPARDLFVVGSFWGPQLTLGAGQPGEITLSNAGERASFVAKYASSGALLWAKRITESSYGASSVAVDGQGALYVSGGFDGQLVLGAGEPGEVTLVAEGPSDVFLAKFTGSGALLWARRAGGADEDYGGALAVDAVGEALLSGAFTRAATFGEGEPGETTIGAPGRADSGFLASFSASGALRWARSLDGASPSGVALDARGNAGVAGSFTGTVVLGEGARSAVLTEQGTAGYYDVFVAQYDSAGALRWARSGSGPHWDAAADLAADAQGNLYLAGSFEERLEFSAGEPGGAVVEGTPRATSFLAKFDPSGVPLWARRTALGPENYSGALALDAGGAIYVSGSYADRMVFGAGEPSETTLSTGPHDTWVANRFDVYLAKFASTGALAWARSDGGRDIDTAGRIAVDGDRGVYLIGWMNALATFGAGEPNETVLGDPSVRTLFAAKFRASGADAGTADADGDAVNDAGDNCPSLPNADQADAEGDGFGDACVPPGSLDARARVGANPRIGLGSRLERGVVLGGDAALAEDVLIERDSAAGRQLQVGRGTRIARESRFGDRVRVGADVRIERGARIGSGVSIGDGAVIGRDVSVADGARILAGAVLGRDSRLGAGAELGAASAVGRNAVLGAGAALGAGAVLEEQVSVGAQSAIGADTQVGDHCQIGEGVRIEAGAVLESFVTVSAGAVVESGAHLVRGLYP